ATPQGLRPEETSVWSITATSTSPATASSTGRPAISRPRRSCCCTGSRPRRACMARPGAEEVQLDLILDYRSNVALYPAFQQYFRTHRPLFLAIWGKNDPHFLPPGAEAYRRDIPDAEVRFLDTGHFALETHADEIAAAMRDFLGKVFA